MNILSKEKVVAELIAQFDKSEAAFVITCQKMDAISTQKFKKKLAIASAKMMIAKNTLLERASHENKKIKKLLPNFKNQIAIVFAYENSSQVASIIKENGYGSVIDVKSVLFEDQVFDSQRFEFLASIPSKEILYAQLCGLLQSPIAKLAYVLQEISKKQGGAEASSVSVEQGV
jgi:large subunit ribosomal protein L10